MCFKYYQFDKSLGKSITIKFKLKVWIVSDHAHTQLTPIDNFSVGYKYQRKAWNNDMINKYCMYR